MAFFDTDSSDEDINVYGEELTPMEDIFKGQPQQQFGQPQQGGFQTQQQSFGQPQQQPPPQQQTFGQPQQQSFGQPQQGGFQTQQPFGQKLEKDIGTLKSEMGKDPNIIQAGQRSAYSKISPTIFIKQTNDNYDLIYDMYNYMVQNLGFIWDDTPINRLIHDPNIKAGLLSVESTEKQVILLQQLDINKIDK